MRTGSIQLARVFGIRIGASPSWFVVALIFIVWLSTAYDDQYGQTTGYLMAVVSVALFFLSLTLHELGHAWVARRNGIGSPGSTCGSSAASPSSRRDSESPGEEFRVSAAGPAVTLLIVIVACVRGLLVGGSGDFVDALVPARPPGRRRWRVLGWLALVNAGLFVFNLIPAFPLDGGRIASAIAWKLTGDRNRGTRFSARLGQAFSYILMGLGIFLLVRGDAGSGIWWILMGWFLGQSATGAVVSSRFSERLEGVTVADVMDTQPVWVPGDTTVLAGPGRVLPALPLAVVPGRRPDLGALPRAAAPAPGRRRRAGGPARRSPSPTWSTRTATRPSASTTTPRSSSSWPPRACARSAR